MNPNESKNKQVETTNSEEISNEERETIKFYTFSLLWDPKTFNMTYSFFSIFSQGRKRWNTSTTTTLSKKKTKKNTNTEIHENREVHV